MTTLTVEHFGAPEGTRDARVMRWTRDWSIDELAGRTVWCLSALPRSGDPLEVLRAHLRRAAGGEVPVTGLDIPTDGPLRGLARRLERMVGGATEPSTALGPAEDELCARCVERGEALLTHRLRTNDIVILDDPLAATLAPVVRDRGAHAVWRIRTAVSARGPAAGAAERFLARRTAAVDAFVTRRRRRSGHRTVERVTALLPSADLLTAKDVEGGRDDLGWASVLADVVRSDREERVGGTLHPRPTVASR
jgi:hypothetical protein